MNAPSPPPALLARELSHHYGSTEALRGIDLTLPAGSFTLLVGPNGAGKSTLLAACQDLLPRSAGRLEIFGVDPAREGARVRASLGVLPETTEAPFPRLTVEETLALHARLRPAWDEAYAGELARRLELRRRQRWSRLSKGEARRAQLTLALAHRAPLLLLDEATDGLDPVARERVLGTLAEHVADTGATVVYATHVLHEAQGLADHLVVLSGGRVRLQDSAEALRGSLFETEVRAREGALPTRRPPTLVRERSRTGASAVWVLRGEPQALHAWAEGAGIELGPLRPLTLAEAAMAYLAGGEPYPGALPATSSAGVPSPDSSPSIPERVSP